MTEYLVAQLAALAGTYIVTKVVGVIGQHEWGKAVLRAAARVARPEDAARERARIDSTPVATDGERSKLNDEQRSAIDHTDGGTPTPPNSQA